MNDKVPCSSTKLIRGGTAYSSPPFELKLQLHGQVNNPYSFGIKQNYKSSATTQVEFTYQEWITPGTYTWIAPLTGTINVEIAGAGGGGLNGRWGVSSGGSGNLIHQQTSVIKNKSYEVIVGKGGNYLYYDYETTENTAEDGGFSKFNDIIAEGGKASYSDYKEGTNGANAGNGNGGKGGNGTDGANGWVKISK